MDSYRPSSPRQILHGIMKKCTSQFLVLWATTSSSNLINAFTTPISRPALFASTSSSSSSLKLSQDDGPSAGTKLISNAKEIAYDGSRFYETGLNEDDCIPSQEYCAIDPETSQPIRLSVGEKERMFLDALQSYYVSGRQVMDDVEFDALKEDLAWSGSDVVSLNRKEIMYLEAMQAYTKGEPVSCWVRLSYSLVFMMFLCFISMCTKKNLHLYSSPSLI